MAIILKFSLEVKKYKKIINNFNIALNKVDFFGAISFS